MVNETPKFAVKEGPDIFSPKDLIQLGRPGQGVANPDGDFALVPYSKHSLEEKKSAKSVYIVSLGSHGTDPIHVPLKKGGEYFWLASRTFAHVVTEDNEAQIFAYNINLDSVKTDSDQDKMPFTPPALVGTIPSASAANFRYNVETGNLVFSAYVYPDGNLTAVKEKDKEWGERGNSAYVYDTTYVRHWDVWQGNKGQQLFSINLSRDDGGVWKLSGNNFNSPLKGTKHYTPVEPFGGTDDFDISATHIVYTTKDPKLPAAWHTKQNVYIVPIDANEEAKELTSGKQGAVHGPVFSNQGSKVAWLELDEDGHESDRAKIVIYDLEKHVRFTVTQDWDRSPSELAFSKDDSFIYFTAGDQARIKIFALPVPPTPSHSTTHPKLDAKFTTPTLVYLSNAASGLQILSSDRLLFTQSSFTRPNDVWSINNLKLLEKAILAGDRVESIQTQAERHTYFCESNLENKRLSQGQEFWFKGAAGKDVQGWIIKPRGWKLGEKKKWPVVLFIHGGPQSVWGDEWSTRWNPNVFAQQGYFMILINPTGSTTFGQEFTDGITEDWGGKPFIDLINGWKYALDQHPEIDPERAVAAGASWGGYAINWIQSNPEFGFGFKALFAHDGVFDARYNGFSTDELFFFNHEWGGRPWDSKSKSLLQKYNPAEYVHKWSTPQLIVHGSKDYRLPETEGIGAFHALQQLGIPSRLVIFPDENHWVLDPGNSLKWHYEVLRWFDQYVGEKK
jgi:dipeptidyl aminopeptidase/acylaminoacyl peptidase